MGLNWNGAAAAAGGAVAEVGAEMGKSAIREGAESRMLAQRGAQESSLLKERAAIEDMRAEKERKRVAEVGGRIEAAASAPVYDEETGLAMNPSVSRERTARGRAMLKEGLIEGGMKQLDAATSSDEAIALERRKRGLPAAQVTPEAAAKDQAYAEYLNQNTKRLKAETDAITGGQKYAKVNAGQVTERLAALASGNVSGLLKREKDEVTGAPKWDNKQITSISAIAGALTRSGMTPQDASDAAMNIGFKPKSDLLAQVDLETKNAPKTVFGGKIKLPNGTEMKEADFKTARMDELVKQNNAEVAEALAGYNIRLPGAQGESSGGKKEYDYKTVVSEIDKQREGGMSEPDILKNLRQAGLSQEEASGMMNPKSSAANRREPPLADAKPSQTPEAGAPGLIESRAKPPQSRDERMSKSIEDSKKQYETKAAAAKVVDDLNKEFQSKFSADEKTMKPQDLYRKYNEKEDGLTRSQRSALRIIRENYDIR